MSKKVLVCYLHACVIDQVQGNIDSSGSSGALFLLARSALPEDLHWCIADQKKGERTMVVTAAAFATGCFGILLAFRFTAKLAALPVLERLCWRNWQCRPAEVDVLLPDLTQPSPTESDIMRNPPPPPKKKKRKEGTGILAHRLPC